MFRFIKSQTYFRYTASFKVGIWMYYMARRISNIAYKVIKKIQNRFLRYHYFKKLYPNYRSITPTDLLEEFKFVCLAKRRNLLVLLSLLKIINNHKNSPEMMSLIPFHATSRFNRAQAMFLTPIISTTTRANLVTMVRLANNIILLVDLDWNRFPWKNDS